MNTPTQTTPPEETPHGICTFLGTGTSTGVPQLGCNCATCRSNDPRDKRLRSSALISVGNKRLLIDAGPDLRQQLITNQIYSVDAILITHEHYDHVGGLDDIRPLGETRIFAESNVLDAIRRNMPYCFAPNSYPGTPKMNLFEIDTQEFSIDGIGIVPIRVMHACLPILGFRIGKMAYLTDVKSIPEAEMSKLSGLQTLVLSALRHETHISHISLSEAVTLAQRVGAETTYFTHASHQIGLHTRLERELPKNMHFAYDNLSISF